MQPVALFLEIEVDAPTDALRAPRRPLLEDLPHAQHARLARNQDVEIAAEAVLKRRRLEELLHELFRLDAALEVDGQLEAVQVGLVAHIGDLTNFASLDELRDLVHDDLRRGRIRDLIDLDHIAFLDVAPSGADAEGTPARVVDLQHLRRVVKYLTAGREIRRRERVQQLRVRILDERRRRIADLAQIE